jgi:hypothetical protein
MSSATNSSLLSNTSNSNESHSPSITSLASTNNNFQSNNTNNNNNVQTETGLSLKPRFESTDSSPSTNSFATNKASNFIRKPLDLRKSDSDSYAYNMVTGSPRPGQLLTPTSFKNILNTSGEQSLATNSNQSIAKALTFSPTIPNKFTTTTNTTTKSKIFFSIN